MKNSYCDLSQEEINKLPEKYKGFLLSPFQFAVWNGCVHVPEDTFKEMIDIITEKAIDDSKLEAEVVNINLADEPYTIYDILARLSEAAEILLYKKNYDGHGYEEIEHCLQSAGRIIIKKTFNI